MVFKKLHKYIGNVVYLVEIHMILRKMILPELPHLWDMQSGDIILNIIICQPY